MNYDKFVKFNILTVFLKMYQNILMYLGYKLLLIIYYTCTFHQIKNK